LLKARFGAVIHTVEAPLQRIDPLPGIPSLEGVEGLIFTSENGVRCFANMSPRRDFLTYCVGPRTAAIAREVGLTAEHAKGNASDLAAYILAQCPDGPLLHLHGTHTQGDIPGKLAQAGLEVQGAAIYEQAAARPPPGFAAALGGPATVIAPLYSPRSATLFAQAAGGIRPGQWVLPCLSTAVKGALPPDLQALATIATAPNTKAMIAAIANHISQRPRLEGQTKLV